MFERPKQASSFSANSFDKGISFGSRVARTARFGGQLARLSFLHTLVVSDNRLYKIRGSLLCPSGPARDGEEDDAGRNLAYLRESERRERRRERAP